MAFRKKIYRSARGAQVDLRHFVEQYNTDRPHRGRWCYGKTPMQTFMDSVSLAREKMLVA